MFDVGPDRAVSHTAEEARTLGGMFRLRQQRSGASPAFYHKESGRWVKTTWGQFYSRARAVAQGLLDAGIRPGDCVAVLGPTQPAWAYYDMGAQLIGAVTMGIYPKQTVEQVRYLLEHSEASVVFVDSDAELETVLMAAERLDSLRYIVPWSDAAMRTLTGSDDRLTSPQQFAGRGAEEDELDRLLATRDPDDTAVLIYTSGTTGPPKGAKITHSNILQLLACQGQFLDFRESDISLSFLPMAHAAERVLAFYGRISAGIATAYASSIAAVLEEVREVQPTLFGSVPRIFEKAYAKIHAEIGRKPAPIQRLFSWAKGVGLRRLPYVIEERQVPIALQLEHAVADRLVFRKIRAAFGGRVRQFITGAAPISMDILEFLWAAGLPVYELYGMTEATVVTHANRPGFVRLGSVGRPLPGIEQRIAEDGEVLLRGPWVFAGYLKNQAATDEAIQDGWLHTGDVGRIDEDGFLFITDRKKHLIITAGGKNLAPANIERSIKQKDPRISHVHAHGDRRPYVTALIAPSPIETLEWGAERGIVPGDEVQRQTRALLSDPTRRSPELNELTGQVTADPRFRELILQAVRQGNEELAGVERVRRFILLDRDLSVEEGELTPTLKLKRKVVEEKFAQLFEAAYGSGGGAVDV